MIRIALRRILPTLSLALGCAAMAAPVPGALSITGTVTLDTTNSLAASGDATQSGSFSATSAGVIVGTSTFGNDPSTVAPFSSQSAALVATGDGIAATLQMAGTFGANSSSSATDGLFVDYLLTLLNNSATDTFDVLFRVLWTNSVTATGPDAFTRSQLSVLDDGGANEVFFTDDTADTLFGDTSFASAGNTFIVSLAPGAGYSFTALQSQRGGAFVDGSSYSAELVASIVLDNVSIVGQPPLVVPTPATLPLLALGLSLLAIARRRHSSYPRPSPASR